MNGIPIPDITGTIEPGLHVYEGAAESPTLLLPVAGNFSGTLTLDFTNAGGASPSVALPGTLDLTVQQLDFQLSPDPVAVIPPSEAQNISTRANVGTGDNVLIGGIIISGNDPTTVVLRAIGPSLARLRSHRRSRRPNPRAARFHGLLSQTTTTGWTTARKTKWC